MEVLEAILEMTRSMNKLADTQQDIYHLMIDLKREIADQKKKKEDDGK
jgi:hypothetical protein